MTELVLHGLLLAARLATALVVVGALAIPGRGLRMALWTPPLLLCTWPWARISEDIVREAGQGMLGAVVGEGLFGAGFALALITPLLAARWSGALTDPLWFDTPSGHAQGGPPAVIETLFPPLAAALFAGLGGLRVVARTFVRGLTKYPLGSLSPTGHAPWPLIRLVSDALGWALLMTAPTLLAYALSTVALGLLARVARPHGGFWTAALPMRIGLLLIMLVMTIAGLPDVLPTHVAEAVDAAATIGADKP